MYNIKELARYTINYCLNIGRPISNLQLQKILYFMQGEFFKEMGYWLTDDDFYAWPFGPVNKEVYAQYCGYGGGLIYEQEAAALSETTKDVINPIIERYAKMSSSELVRRSHKDGGAWKNAYNGNKNTLIPKLSIQYEFVNQ